MIESDLTGLDRVRAALVLLELDARVVSPGTPMPTVPLAASAVGASVEQIVKTLVFTTAPGKPVIAIANGTRRVDRQLLAVAAGEESLKLASPSFVQDTTGFPAGGVSPVGIRTSGVPVVVDPAVLEQERVFAGAGTEDDLLEMSTADLVRVTGAIIRSITRAD